MDTMSPIHRQVFKSKMSLVLDHPAFKTIENNSIESVCGSELQPVSRANAALLSVESRDNLCMRLRHESLVNEYTPLISVYVSPKDKSRTSASCGATITFYGFQAACRGARGCYRYHRLAIGRLNAPIGRLSSIKASWTRGRLAFRQFNREDWLP